MEYNELKNQRTKLTLKGIYTHEDMLELANLNSQMKRIESAKPFYFKAINAYQSVDLATENINLVIMNDAYQIKYLKAESSCSTSVRILEELITNQDIVETLVLTPEEYDPWLRQRLGYAIIEPTDGQIADSMAEDYYENGEPDEEEDDTEW